MSSANTVDTRVLKYESANENEGSKRHDDNRPNKSRGSTDANNGGTPSPGGVPRARRALAGVGPVPQRAPVGHRARGLQRERQRLGLLQPRPGPLPRLPARRG